jgi:hypothetical protein
VYIKVGSAGAGRCLPVDRGIQVGGVSMLDLAFVVLVLIFFAASWGFVWLCERLRGGGA